MSNLPYLNLGCGSHFNKQWINVDFLKTGDDVIAHNLLDGVPFNDNTFEVVYHSHVLEHFPKNKAAKFIEECYRILKPGGIIRIAVPDLEQIVNNYTRLLAVGKNDMDNDKIRADYDWILTEMYDQTVRNESGGEMRLILSKAQLDNEDFIIQRIGYEGQMIRNSINPSRNYVMPAKKNRYKRLFNKLKKATNVKKLKELILRKFLKKEFEQLILGKFRLSGEIHQWMYDIYSLSNLLKDAGFKNIQQQNFDKSSIADWRLFGLDEVNNIVRKPDSLFVEAFKL